MRWSAPRAEDSHTHSVLCVCVSHTCVCVGLTVVLVLGSEHKNMAHNTMKLARLFIRNIVDRLHVALILGSEEAEKGSISDVAKQVRSGVLVCSLRVSVRLCVRMYIGVHVCVCVGACVPAQLPSC